MKWLSLLCGQHPYTSKKSDFYNFIDITKTWNVSQSEMNYNDLNILCNWLII